LHQRRRAARLREIGVKCGPAPLRRAHLVHRPIGLHLRTGVAERDVHPARREIASDDETDALTARYKRNFVSEIHKNKCNHESTKARRRKLSSWSR
jgi:hypothetical protein